MRSLDLARGSQHTEEVEEFAFRFVREPNHPELNNFTVMPCTVEEAN